MKDTFSSTNFRDWAGRYEGTFGWLLQGEHKLLVQLIDHSNTHVYFITEPEGMRFHAKIDSGVQFEFMQVDHAWINTDKEDEIYLLARNPQKQWRRGVHSNNTIIRKPSPRGLRDIAVTLPHLQRVYSDVSNSYRRKYPVTPSSCVAISRAFAIAYGELYLYERVIGALEGRVLKLFDTASIVAQELRDAINRNNFIDEFMLEITSE
jgi:hypothetical protein